ncbi:hypothetical protein YC2023_013044 [Brassica napus]
MALWIERIIEERLCATSVIDATASVAHTRSKILRRIEKGHDKDYDVSILGEGGRTWRRIREDDGEQV